MNTTRLSGPGRSTPSTTARSLPTAVEILACGSADRGDDGAPIAACDLLRPTLPPDVRLRIVGQLDIDDLLSIRSGAGLVVVDAAVGIEAGAIVELPLSGLGDGAAVRPRSSHALAIPEVVGLAEMIRGRPLSGRLVAIGGQQFGLGRPISRPVAAALPALSRTILDAVEHVRQAVDAGHRGA